MELSYERDSMVISIPYFGRRVTSGSGTTGNPLFRRKLNFWAIAAITRAVSSWAKPWPMQRRGAWPHGEEGAGGKRGLGPARPRLGMDCSGGSKKLGYRGVNHRGRVRE